MIRAIGLFDSCIFELRIPAQSINVGAVDPLHGGAVLALVRTGRHVKLQRTLKAKSH